MAYQDQPLICVRQLAGTIQRLNLAQGQRYYLLLCALHLRDERGLGHRAVEVDAFFVDGCNCITLEFEPAGWTTYDEEMARTVLVQEEDELLADLKERVIGDFDVRTVQIPPRLVKDEGGAAR